MTCSANLAQETCASVSSDSSCSQLIRCFAEQQSKQRQVRVNRRLRASHNFVVVPELEVILYNLAFIFLDFILVQKSSLHLCKVPRNDIGTSGCNDSTLSLAALIEPVPQFISWTWGNNWHTHLAGVKDT